MAISAYNGVPEWEIKVNRTTAEGLSYNLDHPDGLVVDMRYTGRESSRSNSQGWERDANGFFRELRSEHPEYFSPRNNAAIDAGTAPKVDAQFVNNFPQYKGYEGETLVHHHIGGDGQAVAVPKSMHTGFGEIHNVEKNLGITQNCREFSAQCEQVCLENSDNMGKRADYFRDKLGAEESIETKEDLSTETIKLNVDEDAETEAERPPESVEANADEGDAAFFAGFDDESDEMSAQEDRGFFEDYGESPSPEVDEDRAFFDKVDRGEFDSAYENDEQSEEESEGKSEGEAETAADVSHEQSR